MRILMGRLIGRRLLGRCWGVRDMCEEKAMDLEQKTMAQKVGPQAQKQESKAGTWSNRMAKKANGSEMREPSHALQELGYGPSAKRRYPRNDVIQSMCTLTH